MISALTFLAALAVAGVDPAAHKADVETWQKQRDERLRAPDGWLTLVGLHWIEPGTNTVGSAKSNAVVLAAGPATLGTLELADGKAVLTLAEGADARIDATTERKAVLAPDTSGKPTLVRFGNASFYLIERSGRFALRVKDNDAPTR